MLSLKSLKENNVKTDLTNHSIQMSPCPKPHQIYHKLTVLTLFLRLFRISNIFVLYKKPVWSRLQSNTLLLTFQSYAYSENKTNKRAGTVKYSEERPIQKLGPEREKGDTQKGVTAVPT